MKFFEKLKSRKFIAAIAAAVLGVLGDTLNLPEPMTAWAIKALVAYILGEAIVDAAAAARGN
jgi:hypothetical protein